MRIYLYATYRVKTLSWTQLQCSRNLKLFLLVVMWPIPVSPALWLGTRLMPPALEPQGSSSWGLPGSETGPPALLLRYGSAIWKCQCPHGCESTHCFWQLKKHKAQPMVTNETTVSIRFKLKKCHASFNAGGHNGLPILCPENMAAI